jgi:hypothetical protein
MIKHVLLLALVSALVLGCPTPDDFRLELKKGLFDYLQNPEYSRLTVHEVKDLMVFYLTEDIVSQNCSKAIGAASGLPIEMILSKTENIQSSVIPRCSDNTAYGECSPKKPKFCYSGMLMSLCSGPDKASGTQDDCGCNEYDVCQDDGSCSRVGISCYTDENCGESGYTGEPYCTDNEVHRQYIDFNCLNPGTGEAYCIYQYEDRLIETCALCENGACA